MLLAGTPPVDIIVNMGKKILVVGGGGREHAIVTSLSECPSVDSVICSPGNAGTAAVSGCRNIRADGNDEILNLALREQVDLVVPGPELPLADGLVDILNQVGIQAFGPPAESACLESSKRFAKDFMSRNKVSTAEYAVFSDPQSARASLDRFGFPVVIKADGLAAGKGVLICKDRAEAEAAVDTIMVNRDFGSAGDLIVLEECLVGWETSIIGITDGKTFMPFLPAKDHKRAGEGETGLNTGGMGVIAPHPLVTADVMDNINCSIIEPTMTGLAKEGLGYAGFLFIGVMVTAEGAKTLEYNVRFGDPEAQALLPLLAGDLNHYMVSALEGRLSEITPSWRGGASCCVVMASGGYPGSYETGFPISGIPEAENLGARVYCAGVKSSDFGNDRSGQFLSGGGRVLGVTALADKLNDACRDAYAAVKCIDFDGGWYRSDIGS